MKLKMALPVCSQVRYECVPVCIWVCVCMFTLHLLMAKSNLLLATLNAT